MPSIVPAYWPPARIEKARKMWAEDATISQIAREVGVSVSGVAGFMHRNRHFFPRKTTGVPPRQGKCYV